MVVSSPSLEVYKSRAGTHLEELLARELKYQMGTLLGTVQPKILSQYSSDINGLL